MRAIPDETTLVPVFLRRPIGKERQSENLARLRDELDSFLQNENPLSEKELKRIFELMHRGEVDLQKKRRCVFLKKIERMHAQELKQSQLAKKLGIPRHKK